MSCNIDEYLSPQAQRARNTANGVSTGPYGDFFREDDKRSDRRKGSSSLGMYDWDADNAWWDAKDAVVKAQSRGGGTTNHDF